MAEVDAVCVNYRSEDDLVDLARALAGADATRSWSLFAVDCSGTLSGSGRALAVAARGMALTVLDPGANVGFGPAANLGARAGAAPVLLLVNPDVAPVPDGLAATARLGLEFGATAWSGIVRNPDGTVQRNSGPPPSLRRLALEYLLGRDTRLPPSPVARRVGVLTGAVLFVRRDRFTEVGGFDESLPLYMEDVDVSVRLGPPLVQFPVEVGVHTGGTSAAQAPAATWLLLHASRVAFFRRAGAWSGRFARTVVIAGCALRRLAGAAPASTGNLAALVRATRPGVPLARLLPPRPQTVRS